MKSILLAITSLLVSLSAYSQFQTIPLKEATKPLDGVIYTLPKTILIIEAETQKTTETPGIYAQYAERFLGLTNVIQTEKVAYELTGIQVVSKATPDYQNSYVVIPASKGKRTGSVELTPDGFLQSLKLLAASREESPIPKRNPVFCSLTPPQAAGNALAEFNGGATACIPSQSPVKTTDITPACQNYQTAETSVVTREMQQSTSTAKLAELAATQLFNLRESRLSILNQETEQSPSDGRSYELVLGEINRMEQYYMELFTGKKTVTKQKTRFEFEPKKDEETVLLRYTQQKGLVDKSDLSGSPVLIKVLKQPGAAVEALKENKEAKPKVTGVYYRLPGTGKITISDSKTVFFDEKMTIAQFGTIQTLPSESAWQIEMCPETGALMKTGN